MALPALPLPDHVLLRQLGASDPAAFATIFRTYYAPLVRFARTMLAEDDDASDVVQDVFTALWEGRATRAIHGAISTYLFAAVQNGARMRIRHETVVTRTEAESAAMDHALGMSQHAPDPHVALEHRDLSRALAAFVRTLPDHQRAAAVLRWRYQLPYNEIGAILGVSPDAARVQIDRIERKLATLLAPFRG